MQRIDIDLQPSKQFIGFMSCILLASIIIILLLAITKDMKIILCSSVLCYGAMIFWRHGFLLHPKSIKSLSRNNSEWWLHDSAGVLPMQLSGHSTVTAFACILRFVSLDGRSQRTCMIFPDSLRSATYRSLLVQLRTMKISESKELT